MLPDGSDNVPNHTLVGTLNAFRPPDSFFMSHEITTLKFCASARTPLLARQADHSPCWTALGISAGTDRCVAVWGTNYHGKSSWVSLYTHLKSYVSFALTSQSPYKCLPWPGLLHALAFSVSPPHHSSAHLHIPPWYLLHANLDCWTYFLHSIGPPLLHCMPRGNSEKTNQRESS